MYRIAEEVDDHKMEATNLITLSIRRAADLAKTSEYCPVTLASFRNYLRQDSRTFGAEQIGEVDDHVLTDCFLLLFE